MFRFADNHVLSPANDTMLLFEKCGKGRYFSLELREAFRRTFDKFSEPCRIKAVGIYIANNVAKLAEIVQHIPHFS